MAEEFKVLVGVEVSDSELQALNARIKGANIDDIDINVNTNEASNRIKNLKSQILELGNLNVNIGGKGLNTAGKNIQKTVNNVSSQYKQLASVASRIDNLEIKLAGLDSVGDANQISVLKKQLESLRTTYKELFKGLSGNLSTDQLQTLSNKVFETQDKIQLLEAKIKDLKNAAAQDITLKLDTASLDKQFSEITNSVRKLKEVPEEIQAAMSELSLAYNSMQLASDDGDIDGIIQNYERWEKVLKRIKNLTDIEVKSGNTTKFFNDKQALDSDIQIWLKENSAAAQMFGSQLEALRVKLRSCDAIELDNLKAEFQDITKQAAIAGKTGLSTWDRLKQQMSEYGTYLSVSSLIAYSTEALRAMYDNVLEVDTAMTGLYRVTDLTADQYDKLYDNMIVSAKKYGASLSDMIDSTAGWARLGFDAATSNRLAEVTTMYQHISDLDNETAVENLVTAYKGFQEQLETLYKGDEAAAVQYIADIFNELDNNFAVTADNIGAALSKSASALSLAGNSIQESAAMVTGITEVTQDPEKAGSALKILSLRLRGMKGELEAIGEETDENVESISKMQTQVLNLTKGKVNIFNDDGSFKSTYEIMDGIAEIYKDLSSTDQAELLETIAGKFSCQNVQKCA